MTIQLNTKAVNFYKSLINKGAIDGSGSWGFSGDDGNKLLGAQGENWENYAKYFLAIDTEQKKNTKAYYKYPVGKGDKIYRRGVIAAKSRGAAEGVTNIVSAADALLQMIDKKIGKKDNEDFSYRCDFVNLQSAKMYKTDEGFLRGDAIVTNIGVFPYVMPDGSIRNELRHPDEVFKKDSLDTLVMKAITNDHPGDMVNIDNIKDFQVGMTGSEVKHDSFHVSVPILINDMSTINDIDNGKQGLSCGYGLQIDLESGVWMGVKYDAVQRNIKYNHVAVVERGRAGDAARMRFDSLSETKNYYDFGFLKNIIDFSKVKETKKESEEAIINMKTINIDGIDYQAEAEVIKEITRLRNDNEKLTTNKEKLDNDIVSLQAKVDQFADEKEQFKKDIDEMKSKNPAEVETLVKQRLVVLDAANRLEVEVKAEDTELEIKKNIIKKVFPSSVDKIDKSDEHYVNARFDGVLEKLNETENKIDALNGDSLNEAQTTPSSDKAYEDMLKRDQNAWKGEVN